jgi:hypothetical protein
MTNVKSSDIRRTSLCPPRPQADRDPPNASMVDGSSVRKTLTKHHLQHDQETATVQDHQKQLDEQRPSLVAALKIIEVWDKRNSIEHSTSEIHQFHTNNQIKK